MTPPDLVVFGLVVQALAIGHAAVQLGYEPARPRHWWWLPLVLILGYYLIATYVPPASLRRDGPPNPNAWVDACRYLMQVGAFSTAIEALLHALRKQGRALRRSREGSFGGRP